MSRRGLRAFVVCAALAVLHTWPLATDPAGLSRHDNADTTLTTWIVSWVAHALPRDPLHIFDAPMFHPERRTLAYSEPLLVPGAMALPLRAAGLDATTTYNLLVLLGFTLSAWAMWRVVAAWTGDEAAGAVAGLAYAFNSHLLTRFGHLQAIHAEAIPLLLFALDRVVARARRRDGVLLGCGLTLVGLTSIYQLAFAAGATLAGLAARAPEWRRRASATLGAAALGIGLGGLLLAPMLWQYLAVSREWGLARTLADSAAFAATWRDYLGSGSRLHLTWSRPFASGAMLFPGVTVTLLALVGLAAPSLQRGRVRMMVAIGLLGVLMSFGPVVPGYAWLFEHVPLLQATRATSRWGFLALTALAVLAAFGVVVLRARLAGRYGTLVAVLANVLVTIEALRTPMAFTPTPSIAPVYARIAAIPNAVLLEFPTYGGPQVTLNAPYLLAQTTHFKPMVAGYSGVFTPAYGERLADLQTFPSEVSRRRLRTMGVTHIVLHLVPLRAAVGQAAIDGVDAVPWVRLEFADEATRLYVVLPDAP